MNKLGYMVFFENKKDAKISFGYVTISCDSLGIYKQEGLDHKFCIGCNLEVPINDRGVTYFYSFDKEKAIQLATKHRDLI